MKTPRAGDHPDVMVVCGPADDRLWERSARLIVDPIRQRIEVGRVVDDTLDWSVVGPGQAVFNDYGPLSVSDLHEAVERVATT